MRKSENSDVIVALATAMGSGSIAVIRVSGTDSIKIVNKVFKGSELVTAESNTIHFGRIVYRSIEIDQVLVSIFREPNSYTGENSVEISCHSNQFIVEDIISIIINNGARQANPGEFSFRSFMNRKIDLSQAEAVSDLISSKSRLASRNSIMQMEGILSKKIKNIRQQLINLVSNLEIDLDFSEEDIPIISYREMTMSLKKICDELNSLVTSYNYAKVLNGSIEIVIIGKPNVGKSSLLNTLLGEERAIVTSHPGTTRDTIDESIIINNVHLKISDTAGIRESENIIEQQGVIKSWKKVDNADLIIWVVDVSDKLDSEDYKIHKSLKTVRKKEVIIVGNKIDIGIDKNTNNEISSYKMPIVKVSAKTGEAIERLKNQILTAINSKYENLGEELVITNLRQKNILLETIGLLMKAKISILKELGNEFAVVDIRDALNELGKITGETETDDILNNIFSNFCIGK